MRTLGCLLVGLLCIAVVFFTGYVGAAAIMIVLLLAVLFRKGTS